MNDSRRRRPQRADRSLPARPEARALAIALALVAALVAAPDARSADRPAERIFEGKASAATATALDELVIKAQRADHVRMAPPCSDEVFVRRAYLDIIGTLPERREVVAFLDARGKERRAELIDALLAREEFADYWSMRWCDTLRVKSEFPINLWPNAVQAYHHWVRDAVRRNMRYDVFARELLTSSGSNFRVPAVNFYRAVQGGDAPSLAGAVALTFMGSRIEAWPQARRDGLAALLSRVRTKSTHEWKEEIVHDDPAPLGPLEAVLPDGSAVVVPGGTDPRRVLADWLISADNPWFARCAVNRIWAWVFGRGLVHEPDDFRPDNPAVMPAVLDYLAAELVKSGWDQRHVLRLILRSRTYQQSPVPVGDAGAAQRFFGCYPVRRLDAEVLIDALSGIGGQGETYLSQIPEPWTWVPDEERTIALADGSITSSFLVLFGRPARDTGRFDERSNEPTDDQRLYLLNSTEVRRRIENSPRVRAAVQSAGRNLDALIDGLYLTLLSRHVADEERDAVRGYFQSGARNSREAAADVAWALVNTKEFLYRH